MADAITLPSTLTDLQKVTTAMVSKGIYAILLKLKTSGEADTSRNILNGYTIGSITSGGDTVTSEEFQDQLLGGTNKTFISGAIDPGDFTISTYFNPDKPKPEIDPVVNSIVTTPQFILILATTGGAEGALKGFWAGGVNYNGGQEIKGEYAKIIGSSFKFKASGEVKVGFAAVGELSMALYSAGATTETPSGGNEEPH
jgi:hypothetical protein